MRRSGKPLVWLHGEIKTPPFSAESRRHAGFLLRLMQLGTALSMPHSWPMPSIGSRCHELRIRDVGQRVISCKHRFRIYDELTHSR